MTIQIDTYEARVPNLFYVREGAKNKAMNTPTLDFVLLGRTDPLSGEQVADMVVDTARRILSPDFVSPSNNVEFNLSQLERDDILSLAAKQGNAYDRFLEHHARDRGSKIVVYTGRVDPVYLDFVNPRNHADIYKLLVDHPQQDVIRALKTADSEDYASLLSEVIAIARRSRKDMYDRGGNITDDYLLQERLNDIREEYGDRVVEVIETRIIAKRLIRSAVAIGPLGIDATAFFDVDKVPEAYGEHLGDIREHYEAGKSTFMFSREEFDREYDIAEKVTNALRGNEKKLHKAITLGRSPFTSFVISQKHERRNKNS